MESVRSVEVGGGISVFFLELYFDGVSESQFLELFHVIAESGRENGSPALFGEVFQNLTEFVFVLEVDQPISLVESQYFQLLKSFFELLVFKHLFQLASQ